MNHSINSNVLHSPCRAEPGSLFVIMLKKICECAKLNFLLPLPLDTSQPLVNLDTPWTLNTEHIWGMCENFTFWSSFALEKWTMPWFSSYTDYSIILHICVRYRPEEKMSILSAWTKLYLVWFQCKKHIHDETKYPSNLLQLFIWCVIW